MRIITNSPEETIQQGELLSKTIKENLFIGLYGQLGAGKTYFVKGIAKGLGITENITSPSFVIVKIYEGRLKLYHIDLYRIFVPEEEMLWEYIHSEGVCVVEWAERLGSLLPENRIDVRFRIIGENQREVNIESPGT